jgi:predicted MFS family arabinose efflux permease
VAVVLFCALDSAVYGASTVVYVPLSVRLGTGPGGYSYMLAGAALGGVLGAGLASRLSHASRLAPVIMGSICLQALPFLATIPLHSPVPAAALQVASGTGMVIVDVLALTTLQRDLPGDVLSRVLGIFQTTVLAGILLASLAAGVLLAHAGLNATLAAIGAGIPAIALLGLPALLRADRTSAATAGQLRPRAGLLSELDLLAGADHATLERIIVAGDETCLCARPARPAPGQA